MTEGNRKVDMSTTTPTKHLTVKNINAMLPLVSQIGQDIHRIYGEIMSRKPVLDPQSPYSPEVVEQIGEEVTHLLGKVDGYFVEIRALGGQVESCHPCTICFATVHKLCEVDLIWSLGQDRVTLWKHSGESMSNARDIIYRK